MIKPLTFCSVVCELFFNLNFSRIWNHPRLHSSQMMMSYHSQLSWRTRLEDGIIIWGFHSQKNAIYDVSPLVMTGLNFRKALLSKNKKCFILSLIKGTSHDFVFQISLFSHLLILLQFRAEMNILVPKEISSAHSSVCAQWSRSSMVLCWSQGSLDCLQSVNIVQYNCCMTTMVECGGLFWNHSAHMCMSCIWMAWTEFSVRIFVTGQATKT